MAAGNKRKLVKGKRDHDLEPPTKKKKKTMIANPQQKKKKKEKAFVPYNERRWPCSDCSARFQSEANLTRHENQVHKGIIIKCPVPWCDWSCKDPSDLNKHNKRKKIHDLNPKDCPIKGCKFRLDGAGDLEEMKMHVWATHSAFKLVE